MNRCRQLPSVSVVIPSASRSVFTLSSIPNNVEVVVVCGGNASENRNRGARLAKASIIVFCDDDIAFTSDFFWNCILAKRDKEIMGLEDYDFGLLITRVLIVDKEDFFIIGDFDEKFNYMEDTDFCIRAERLGFKLVKLPRDSVYHRSHKSRVTKIQLRKNFLQMVRKHRVAFAKYFFRFMIRRLEGRGVSNHRDLEGEVPC